MKSMTLEKQLFLKMASLFLQYPDEHLLRDMDSAYPIMEGLPGPSGREVLEALLGQMKNSSSVSLQEEYTRTFDLNPVTTLNLTYHQWGDDRQRGQALARLNHLYHEAGYEAAAHDLPDFLPLVLEFLSVCSDEAFAAVTGEHKESLSILADHLRERKSIYSDLCDAVLKSWEGRGY